MTRLKRLCLFEWISAFAAASKRDAQKRARALSPAPLGAVSAGSKEGAAALLQGLLLTQSSSQNTPVFLQGYCCSAASASLFCWKKSRPAALGGKS